MEPDSTDNVDILEHPIHIPAVSVDYSNLSSEERLIALSTTEEPSQVVPGEPEAGIGRVPGDPIPNFWHFPCYYLQDFRSHQVQLPPCRYPDLYNITCSHPECPVRQSWEDDEHFGPNHGHFCELYTTDGILVIVHFADPFQDSIYSGELSFQSAASPDPRPTSPDPRPTPCSRCNGSGHEPEPLHTPNSDRENPEEPPVNDWVVLRRSARIRAMQRQD